MSAPKKYPDEVRERAVRLVLDVEEEAGSVTGACRRVGEQLGINADTLRGWVKQAQIDAGVRPGVTTSESARIRELEKENAELRRANAILRTASAFLRRLCHDHDARWGSLFFSLPWPAAGGLSRCAAPPGLWPGGMWPDRSSLTHA